MDITPDKLTLLIQAFIEDEEEKDRPFLYSINDVEVTSSVKDCLKNQLIDTEKTIDIVFKPQAVFKVSPVSRCSSSMPGHGEPVIVASFSANGRHLASGSGDATVRFWDLTTETPQFECKGHRQWVLALSWAPDGSKLASGDRTGLIMLWDPNTGKQIGRTLTGHNKFITALSFEPLHSSADGSCKRLASSSKDGDIRIWDCGAAKCLMSMTSHTMNVTCLRWGGSGLIYSASQDRTIKVWRAQDGKLCRTLQGHGHWVNVLALNTDYVIRTGAFDPAKASLVPDDLSKIPTETLKRRATSRYESVVKSAGGSEILVSGSDDFTIFMWKPESRKDSVARLTGHQQTVNDVKFSPDARFVASASFDKSVRLWDGHSGKFLAVFRGHVQAVYQLAWSFGQSNDRVRISRFDLEIVEPKDQEATHGFTGSRK